MKKIFLCLCLLLSACSMNTKQESIVCSTITHDESVRIDIEYTYDNANKITKIEKTVRVYFGEAKLKEKTLQEYYDELEDVEIIGAIYSAEMDIKNNAIISITSIDLSAYDFAKDYFELGNKEEYDDITKLIQEIYALGYYSCKE